MAKSIEEATTGLIEAIEQTDTMEVLSLCSVFVDMSNHREESKSLLDSFGSLVGAVLTEKMGRDDAYQEQKAEADAEAAANGGHLARVYEFAGGEFAAICYCGFSGEAHSEFEDASIDASEHLVEAR